MKVPPGMSEQEVLDAIERCARLLGPKFAFGPYEVEDIKQLCRLHALELLEKGTYEPSRPLTNYLFTHIRRRLINLKRDRLRRTDSPCRRCYDGDPCEDGRVCRKHEAWARRQDRKGRVLMPISVDVTADTHEERMKTPPTAEADAEIKEIVQLVDERLPLELRADWLKMRSGVHVAKKFRDRVEQAVSNILADVGLELPGLPPPSDETDEQEQEEGSAA